MRLQRSWIWVLALAMLTVGCTKSTLGANERVTVTGTAVRPDGGPLSGSQAVLVKQPDVGEVVTGVFEVGASLGLACLSSQPPSLCSTAHTVTTDTNGHFSFSLTGSETQGSVGDADTFLLATRDTPSSGQTSGASVTEQFIINTPTLALPNLKLWEPRVAFSGNVTSVSVSFDAAPSGSSVPTGVTFTDGQNALVWTQSAQSGEAIDARLLEDAQGGLVATTGSTGQASQTSVTFDNQSGEVAFTGTAGPAPSRGAACYEQGASGAVQVNPCTLTDGDFASAIAPQSCTGQSCASTPLNGWAYVDLGAPKSFSLIVVRGPFAACVVDTSNDATQWTTLLANGQSGVFSVSSSGTARYVRVRAAAASDQITGLAEISVW